MARLTHLNALQALEATLRLGSMRLAAEELGITPAALGQRIKTLEDYLGYPLVQRTREGVSATPATSEIQGTLHDAFKRLSDVAQGLKFDSPNIITLKADQNWYECWLKPRLGRLAAERPELTVEVVSQAESRVSADLTIRFASPGPANRLLFTEYLAPVVTPSMYRLLHERKEVNILESMPLLHLDIYHRDSEALNAWPKWFEQFGYRTKGFDRGIRYTSARNALDATISDSGALLAGVALCLDEMERDRLCLLFASEMGGWTRQGYCLYCKREPRSQVAKFIRWLEGEAQSTRRILESLVGAPS